MKANSAARSRRGTYIPLLAVVGTAMFGMVALAIDLGMMTIGRTECQNAADAGALTGARMLNNRSGVANNNKTQAVAVVKDVIPDNTFMNTPFDAPPDANIQVGVYDYNTTAKKFIPDFTQTTLAAGKSWTAVRATVSQTQPMFFAKIFGVTSLPNGAVATAVHRPRDVAIILDFSVSMRFGSMSGWMGGMGNSNDVVYGTLNPDPNYPQFGHYGRYASYNNNPSAGTMNDQSGNPAGAALAATPAGRPNPMQMLQKFTCDSEEVLAPNNHTVETPGGPPIAMDFRFDPSNRRSPATKVTTVNVNGSGLGLWNAFHRWFTATPSDTPDTSLALVDQTNNFKYSGMRPPVNSTVDNTGTGAAAVVRTFTWTGYNAFDLDGTSGPTPAPDGFATQSASGLVPYVGDVYPGKQGAAVDATTVNGKDPTNAAGPAVNAAEMLGWGSNNPVTTAGSGTPPDRTGFPAGVASTPAASVGLWGYEPRGANNGYAADWSNFRDATWERYGYDLNVADYAANRPKTDGGPTWDPRWDWRVRFTAGTTTPGTPSARGNAVVGWQTGGSGNGAWQHNTKTVTGSPGDSPTNLRTVPPDSTATTGTGATSAQAIGYRPILQDPNNGSNVTARISSFDGYSMGPGYYGKTFWMWPPDPRFGVQNPSTGATTIWPDVTSPDWPALTSSTYATDAPNADPAFSTKGKSGTTTTTYTKSGGANPGLIPMCDWRRRFFLPSDGSETDPTTGFDPTTDAIDQTLFSTSVTKDASNAGTGTAGVLNRGGGFRVNYRAVLKWIKTGPQVLPTNLRAGRLVYYTSIPDNCDNAGSDTDQRFWRDYIDYVLGYTGNTGGYNPEYNSAGVEYKPWPEGGSLSIGTTAGYTPGASGGWGNAKPLSSDVTPKTANAPAQTADPKPYTNYTTNPSRPRQYFWFGPVTMIDFLSCRATNGTGGTGGDRHWWSGNVHEAQCWQLKAAINSALEDIRQNHPNDYCGLTYFAGDTNYSAPRAPMGQKWTDLKNALFYNGPKTGNSSLNLLPLLNPTSGSPDTTTEIPPYDPANLGGTFMGNRLAGIVPNAFGSTDPNSGFAMGFNLLASAPSLSTTDYGTNKGRLGAAKIVIYETDGVPNGTPLWSIQGNGPNTYYSHTNGANETYPVSGLTDPVSGLDMTFSNTSPVTTALAVVQRTVAPVTTSTSAKSGFSLPNAPARVYPIGFGDLFTGYDGTNSWAGPAAATNGVRFLRRTGQVGNTLPTTGDPPLPTAFVISGSYQNRINNLRDTLQRIMQSGVQVTLIE